MKPISPDEIIPSIPEFVIEAVNTLLKEKYKCATGKAVLIQDEVVEAILSAAEKNGQGLPRRALFGTGWLDFEHLYGQSGWEVVYAKPGYCDTFKANYTFTKKK